jgi:hypothetical protein
MSRSSAESRHPCGRPGVEPGVNAVDPSATRSRPRPVVESSVNDVDGYQRSVSGVAIEAVREGVGVGPNTVRSVTDGLVISSSNQIRFPILT